MSARLSTSNAAELEAGVSPWLPVAMLAGLSLVLVALLVAAIPLWLSLLLAILSLAACARQWWLWQQLEGARLCCQDELWEFIDADGRRLPLQLRPHVVGGERLMVLRFRGSEQRSLNLLLCADRNVAEDWRRLRCRLFASLRKNSSGVAG